MRPSVLTVTSFATIALGLVLPAANPFEHAVQTTAVEAPVEERSNACADLYFITARGSYEAPGEGCIGLVASEVCSLISDASCNAVGVTYPATMSDSDDYISSESIGVQAMATAAKQYHKNCPKAALVLLGYSQGAQVVGDTICGHSEPGWPTTDPISGSWTNKIIAVVQMGDPTFIANMTYDVGSSTTNGVVVRENVTACEPFADRIQSWCDAGDPYCAGGDDMLVHHSYIINYAADAASFVFNQYLAYTNSTSKGKAGKKNQD